jgi:UDP-N-acetyl-D-galactosamine dehydrogenase
LHPLEELKDLDCVIVAVAHRQFLSEGPERIVELVKPGGVLVDVKSAIAPSSVPPGILYWSL